MALSSYELELLRKYGPFGVTESGKSVIIDGKKYSDYGNARSALK